MNKKIRVGVLYGGRSAEHEVSLQSAKNVIAAIDKDKYEVVPIGIDRNGRWLLGSLEQLFLDADDPRRIHLAENSEPVVLIPDETTKELISLYDREDAGEIDVVFPVLHGTYGEDGTMQGLLKLANVPFVGAGVLGSAVGMDKDVMKRLLRDAGVPVAKFLVFREARRSVTLEPLRSFQEDKEYSFEIIEKELGLPFFVKPANLGSSVGITKVHDESEFQEAITEAFSYDRKIIIEAYIKCRELECSVLGNEQPMTSIVGEIIPSHEFYDYEAKYLDEQGAVLKIPAEISENTAKKVQALAIQAFTALNCEGMARVDCFLAENGEVSVNEINTIPGFTDISMYPALWEKSGISPTELIDRLIQLAIERFEKEKQLTTLFV